MEEDELGAPASASLVSPERPPVKPLVHVMMHRHKYERVCGATGGQRFVVFAPFYEQSAARSAGGVRVLLAPFAEAL